MAAGAVVWCACTVLPAHAQPQPAPAAATPSTVRVAVREFRIEGNTLLPPSEIEAAVEPYKGERSLEDLRQAALAVQASYARAGYGAVVAFVPEQSAPDGVVMLRVIEGKLAAVAVSGQQQFPEENIRASLPALESGRTPDLKRIDAQIQIANENPAKKVQVLLQPGERLGEAQARVSVTERPVQQGFVALDNTGNSHTGHLRASLGWQHANVAGRDHVWSAQFMFSRTVRAWLGCSVTTQPLLNRSVTRPSEVVTNRMPLETGAPTTALLTVPFALTVTKPCTLPTTPRAAWAWARARPAAHARAIMARNRDSMGPPVESRKSFPLRL